MTPQITATMRRIQAMKNARRGMINRGRGRDRSGDEMPARFSSFMARRRAMMTRKRGMRGEMEDERAGYDADGHEVYSEDGTIIGFDFGDFIKGAVHEIKKVANVVGPVIATVYPPAAPAIAGGMALLNAVDKGDEKAKAAVVSTQQAAASGNPQAQTTMSILDIAKIVRDKANTPEGKAMLAAVQNAKISGDHILGVVKKPLSKDVVQAFVSLRRKAKKYDEMLDDVEDMDDDEIYDVRDEMNGEIYSISGFSLKKMFKKINVKKALKNVGKKISRAAKSVTKSLKKISFKSKKKKAAESPAAKSQTAAAITVITEIRKKNKAAIASLKHLKKSADAGDKNALAVVNMIKHTNSTLKGGKQIVVGEDGQVIGFGFGDIVNAVVGVFNDILKDPLKYLLPVVGPLARSIITGKPIDLVEMFIPGAKATLGIPPADAAEQVSDSEASAAADAAASPEAAAEAAKTAKAEMESDKGGGGGGGDYGDYGGGGSYDPGAADEEEAAQEDDASQRAQLRASRRRQQEGEEEAEEIEEEGDESLSGHIGESEQLQDLVTHGDEI